MNEVIRYEHPMSGPRNTTIAILADGRVCAVDVQYGCVLPHGDHAADCGQRQIGGRCTCGLLGGIDVDALAQIDVDALVQHARAHGKFGLAPLAQPSRERRERNKKMLAEMDAEADRRCPRCGTYCYGDCNPDD